MRKTAHRQGSQYTRWRAPLPTLFMAIAALSCCGQPQGAASTGAAVPAGLASTPNAAPSPTPNYIPAPTPGGPRTPPPILPTPTITVTPAPPIPFDRPTPDPLATPLPYATPRPEDPWSYVVFSTASLVPTKDAVGRATTVVVATVSQILPARWTTPDKRRPVNPHDRASRETIFTPVQVEVEQYLKGERPQRQLLLLAYGGTVDQDSMTYADGLRTFEQGQRVVLFLSEPDREPRAHDGVPLWRIGTRYTIAEDGRAWNAYCTVPYQQLLDEIVAAQQGP